MLLLILALSASLVPAASLADAEALIGIGRYREALAALEKTDAPRGALWHLLSSKAYDGLGDPARAVSEAEAALALEPANESLHLQLGQIFLSRNTPLAAFEIFRDALQLFPDSLVIRLGKGLALKELQRHKEAEAELLACLRRKSGLGLAFDGLGTVYLHTSRYEDLRLAAERFRAAAPGDFRGPYYLAAAKNALRREDPAAEQLLAESIRLKPDFAASHALLGKILLDKGAAAEAVPSLETAIRLRPDYTPAHLHLANAYRKLGRAEDAAREFSIVRDLKEKERQPAPSLRYHRGAK